MAGNEVGLTGLWFEGQKYFARGLPENAVSKELTIFDVARSWLDTYFNGAAPEKTPPLAPKGTPFQLRVWRELMEIQKGKLATYGSIARRIADESGASVSARAVGSAVAHNPISLIIPCHRVVGADGRLTGYAGGLERKRYLLKLEGIATDERRTIDWIAAE